MGEWIVKFPEEMDKSECSRLITRVFRILESDGVELILEKEDENETNRDT